MSYSQSSGRNTSDGAGGGLSHLVQAATALSKLVDRKEVKKVEQQPTVLAPKVSDVSRSVSISDDEENAKKTGIAGNKREIFPQRLLAILNDPSLTEVVTWLPNGRSFVIVRPDVFTETVLPKYLPPVDARGSTKYPSFTRKLNRWGFRQITRGPDTGAFHHPLFRRDEPQLCLQMVCQRSRDRRSSSKQAPAAAAATRSLPPKKRMLSPMNEPVPCQPRPTALSLPAHSSCVVSSDDNSSTSGSTTHSMTSSTASQITLVNVAAPPSTVCANTAAEMKPVAVTPPPQLQAVARYVSKDETVIQDALRRSVENERIRTAKAMLYHAYMQALQGR